MKKNKIRKLFLIQVLLLSTLTIAISTAPIALFSTQNNKQGTSTTIEGKIPYASGYKIEWEDGGVPIFDKGGEGVWKEMEICTDGDGGVIITWVNGSETEFTSHILAQRIASNGTKMWGDDGIVICNVEPGAQWAPVICSDGYEGAYIAWQGLRSVSNGRDIYVQKVDRDGNTEFTDNGSVVCSAVGDQGFPDICLDYDKNAIIAWQDERNGNLDIYAQEVSYTGVIKWSNGILICNATGNQEALQICRDRFRGVIIAWVDGRHADYSFYAQRLDLDGPSYELDWNANGTSIRNSTVAGSDYDGQHLEFGNIAVCADNDGGAIFAWEDNRTESYSGKDIYAQRIAGNGTVMWTPNGTAISNELGGQRRVHICKDGYGGAIMAWRDGRTGGEFIYGQRVDENAVPLWTVNGTAIYTDIGENGLSDVCSDGKGGAFVAWGHRDDPPYYEDIFVQKISSDGTPLWTSNGVNIIHEENDQDESRICYDGSEGIIVVWEDYRPIAHVYGDIYAQKIIQVPSAPAVGGGDGGGGGSASAETNIIPLIILSVIIGVASTVMAVSYSVRKKKKAREMLPFQKALDVSRGFEVAGDTFRFFVRIENTLDLAITNVAVKIIPPHTLKLDKKSPSREFLIGDVKPGKFGTAIFYLFCMACADTEINAEIDYKDPAGNLQIEKMHPFPIMSCKFVKPRKISVEEFEEEYQAKEKKTIEIRLREDISDEEAVKMIRDRLTMSTVASSSNSLAMSGRARDGSDILLKSVIKEIEGVKTAVASVVSSNQYVTMGVLSDFMETFSEFRQEAISKFEGLEKGHVEIKETVIRETSKILENQIAEYDLLETRNLELQNEMQRLNQTIENLELAGDFSQANEIKQQIESLSLEFRESNQRIEVKIEEMISNVDEVFKEVGDKFDDLEIYLKDHLASVWEKLKDSWNEYKEGTISRKQLLWRGVKIFGPKILKRLTNILIGQII